MSVKSLSTVFRELTVVVFTQCCAEPDAVGSEELATGTEQLYSGNMLWMVLPMKMQYETQKPNWVIMTAVLTRVSPTLPMHTLLMFP